MNFYLAKLKVLNCTSVANQAFSFFHRQNSYIYLVFTINSKNTVRLYTEKIKTFLNRIIRELFNHLP